MKVTILTAGTLAESYWRDAVAEYQKRLTRTWPLTVVEIGEARLPKDPTPGDIAAALADEAARFVKKIPPRAHLIAMCVEGRALTSEALSAHMENAALRGASEIVFLIGSSHGLDASLKRRADLCLSVSPMTFPHQLCRVLLAEQIYRSAEIARGSHYHK